jgi:MerR family redox-sensitive transcriptional activator SoxR
MTDLLIGELARRAGVSTSSLRYYEKAGLLPPPPRSAKRRHYNPQILGRVRIILLARAAGFAIKETRTFLHGYTSATTPAAHWRALAKQKIEELDALLARIGRMKAILEASFRCECLRLEDCERLVIASKSYRPPSPPRWRSTFKGPLRRTASRKQ